MIVTEVQTVYRSKKKVKICLDNGTDFVLYKNEAYRYGLKQDTELSEEDYDKIFKEIFIPRARSRAMHLLVDQDRSVFELRKKLKDSGYPEEAVDEAIIYVNKYHYLDDERLALNYVRLNQKVKSEVILRMNLKKKGIADDIIDKAIESELTLAPDDMIIRLLEKRHYDRENAGEKEKAKQYRFLMGKGFKSSDITKYL
ncbi:MAG: regulatory protein RecX [Lachnospiraceae bacterium]|jgi:regulatory protein|nr:regulatory protein RecX [Lachnospiraceae bacterium]